MRRVPRPGLARRKQRVEIMGAMRTMLQPTIYALSTKLARLAIGVVRVLGPQSAHVLRALTKQRKEPVPRLTSVRKLYSQQGTLLDEALTIFFKAPHTYTGEDILELHLHGGTAIIKSVLSAINQLHDPEHNVHVRYAENGEFLRRAFLNGKFDLTELEGIREMIDAETELQRVAALSSLTGQTKHVFQAWRRDIVEQVALLTTVIDFGEDHDIDEVADLFDRVNGNVERLVGEITAYLHRVQRAEILLRGIKLILLGPPNAGKSSLLNYLANKDAAIVSDIAGTTRDAIDVPIDISGYKVVVGDTAGIRNEARDTIEAEGIRRAKQKALGGDVVLVVLSAEEPTVTEELQEQVKILQREEKRMVVVVNKQDLAPADGIVSDLLDKLHIPASQFSVVSCKTGHGMEQLAATFVLLFKDLSLSDTADPVVISERAQDLLRNDVLYGLQQFKQWKDADDVVLATESLRQLVEGIGKITGEAIGVEEILGVVFSSFCIGK